MKEFVHKHEDRLHGVLSCFDRMLSFATEVRARSWRAVSTEEAVRQGQNAVQAQWRESQTNALWPSRILLCGFDM